MTQNLPSPQLYTIVSDFYEQGCGRTLMALVCWAYSMQEAEEKFSNKFDAYFLAGADKFEGINYDDRIMQFFVSPKVKEFLDSIINRPCTLIWHQSLHYNFA